MVERQPCKLKVLGSIPSGGFFPTRLKTVPTLFECCIGCYNVSCQFARVVKGVDLRSTAGNCAWARTPQLAWHHDMYCYVNLTTKFCLTKISKQRKRYMSVLSACPSGHICKTMLASRFCLKMSVGLLRSRKLFHHRLAESRGGSALQSRNAGKHASKCHR